MLKKQSIIEDNWQVEVTVPKSVSDQIKYLCRAISKVEWSGILFYTYTGNIKDKTLKINLEYILLMDKGSSGYTEYEFDSDVVKFLMSNPQYTDMNYGHIHSHNSMNVFFSGTDNQELVDNAGNYNFYLSVIVNNANDITGKVAQEVTESGVLKTTYFDGDGKVSEDVTVNRSYIKTIDCVFEVDDNLEVTKEFKSRLLEITSKPSTYQSQYSSQYNSRYNNQPTLFEPDQFDLESMLGKIADPKKADRVIAKWLTNDINTKINGMAALSKYMETAPESADFHILMSSLENMIREEFSYSDIVELWILNYFVEDYLEFFNSTSALDFMSVIEERIFQITKSIQWQI